jgi:UDP-3-O-[3-hydroxymyristoyl] glucosamine N-acyltransferase
LSDKREFSLRELCREIGVEFSGDDLKISGVNTLKEANTNEVSFFHDKRYTSDIPKTKAGAVLIEEKFAKLLPKGVIPLITDEPYLKLALLSKFFRYKLETKTAHPKMGQNCDIDKRVRFGKGVTLGDNVVVMAGAYIGDYSTIGSNSIIYPNVTIYHHTIIGDDCILHAGCVIGADGFGFAPTKEGEYIKIYQNGNVIVGNRVEIGANSTIDRAVFGSTIIEDGVKIDNLVQIGHNSIIGKNSVLSGQTGIAGSTILGKNVTMGGQSGTAGHLKIGDFAVIAGKGGVTKSLKGKKIYAGFPAVEHKLWLRLQAKLSMLIKKRDFK